VYSLVIKIRQLTGSESIGLPSNQVLRKVKGAIPVPDFDRSRLTPLEHAAALALLRTDGADQLFEDYTILECLVDRLSENGFTMLQIYDDVMGRLWDSTALMKRGHNVRNDTILLTRAMLIQIISERG
jgi:hypothetical protein